jgi:hypothetical protein
LIRGPFKALIDNYMIGYMIVNSENFVKRLEEKKFIFFSYPGFPTPFNRKTPAVIHRGGLFNSILYNCSPALKEVVKTPLKMEVMRGKRTKNQPGVLTKQQGDSCFNLEVPKGIFKHFPKEVFYFPKGVFVE